MLTVGWSASKESLKLAAARFRDIVVVAVVMVVVVVVVVVVENYLRLREIKEQKNVTLFL